MDVVDERCLCLCVLVFRRGCLAHSHQQLIHLSTYRPCTDEFVRVNESLLRRLSKRTIRIFITVWFDYLRYQKCLFSPRKT